MNSLALNTRGRSKWFVLSVALALAVVLPTARLGNAQQLQRGISVVMAPTTNAVPMPEADDGDAWIVTVTKDGSLFFGVEPTTPAGLADKMKSRPRNRKQNLYIKADARAPFAAVRTVLTAAHDLAFDAPVLLTSQPESPAPGTVVPPKGLEVHIGPHSNAAAIVVQVNSGQPSPTLTVNNQAIPADALESRLKQLLQNSSAKVVLVKADGLVPFAEVVRVIDACRSNGAEAVLAAPEL